MKRMFLLIVLVATLTAVSCAEPTCYEQTEEYRAAADDIADRFSDATDIAISTPRLGLAGPIAELQAIAREVDDLVVPECASATQNALVQGVNGTIDAFLSFSSQDDDEIVNQKMKDAAYYMGLYEEQMEKLSTPD